MSASTSTLSVGEETNLEISVENDKAKNLQRVSFKVWEGASLHEHTIYFHDEIKFLQALEQLSLAYTNFSQASEIWSKS